MNSSAAQFLLRKPSKDEEYSSFWSTVWPRLVNLGWRYTKGDDADVFLFHEPLLSPDAAASAEPGVYEGVSQVLEVVEKMPSLSYYLTQMALAESKSSSLQNQTSSDNEEDGAGASDPCETKQTNPSSTGSWLGLRTMLALLFLAFH